MQRIKKRETFYLGGYDPRGARHYYNLYKKEAKLQSKVNKLVMNISARKRSEKYIQSWKIFTDSTKTEYYFLEWDNIIRKRWKNNTISIFLDLFFYMKVYMFTGLIVKFGRLSPKQLAPAFYPILYLFLTLWFSYFLANISFDISKAYLPFTVSMGLAILMTYGVIRTMIFIGEKIAVFWLLRIYVFCAKYVFEEMSELDTRINNFAASIAQSIENSENNDIDEILIVAHSVGAMLIIPVLAKVFTEYNLCEEKIKRVSLLTLGECTALVSFLDEAKEYKQQMCTLASQKHLFWLDYTSHIDGGCFPLLDYYTHSGVKINENEGPVFLSPRFHTLFHPSRYEVLRKNRYVAHFLYLMATDIQGSYDYFKMTAGDKRLSYFLNSKEKI